MLEPWRLQRRGSAVRTAWQRLGFADPSASFRRRRWSGGWSIGSLFACVVAIVLATPATSLCGTWDSLLTNSKWYVPEENLLAYMGGGTSFTSPPPTVLWDQTLWALGTSVDGRFSGSSQATFYVSPAVSFSSTSSILGIATEIGQVRMQFTSSGGAKTIGIGQFRDVGGTTAVQMQMVSGPSGGPYTTHWAYMLPYDPDTFTPPDPLPNANITSTQWAWTIDTHWMFQNDSLFGPGGVGSFTITDYRNGYFWGSGEGPAGSPGESFTQLGSITPEGNVLFNVLDGSGNLISLTGLVTGDRWNGRMALRTYEFSGSDPSFGPIGIAVVPEPSGGALAAAAAVALVLGMRTRRKTSQAVDQTARGKSHP